MMRVFCPLVSLFIAAYFPLQSQASTPQELSAKIPTALINQGRTQIGLIHLASFVANLRPVKVQEETGEIARANCDGRTSARWEFGKGIKASANDIQRFPEQASILFLHEQLGMAGFVDDQYWISMGMWFLSQPGLVSFLSKEEKSGYEDWIARNTRMRYAKGSVVGVGGGGEIMTLAARCQSIQRSIREARAGRESREEAIGNVANRLKGVLTVSYPTSTGGCRR